MAALNMVPIVACGFLTAMVCLLSGTSIAPAL
jgi:hypothetical protein